MAQEYHVRKAIRDGSRRESQFRDRRLSASGRQDATRTPCLPGL